MLATLAGCSQPTSHATGIVGHDVETVFYISKSDDHNRVDYGIHVDSTCAPTGNDAVYPYWREFEPPPPVRTHKLGVFEGRAYGISSQRTIKKTDDGGIQEMRLRQFDSMLITITTKKERDGCVAHAVTTIAGKQAELLSVHVTLKGLMSVDHVVVYGTDLQTRAPIEQRIDR
jgi:hypothetical protein